MAGKTTIMIVDDEKDLLTISKKFLENEGYEVHAFGSPESALQHIKQGCTDCKIVVSDIKMPGMSGFELARQLKEIRPDTKVVLMSSFVIHKAEFKKVVPSLDIDDFVMKPFTRNDLIEAVKKCRNELG